jgi:signal transduction histidine kinase
MYSSGDYFLIELSAILLPAVAILLFSVFVMLLFIRRYSRTLKRLYQMNFHGVELERKRIANDLHDQVGASLQQVKKALDVASHSLDKSNAINELNYAKLVVTELHLDLRQLVENIYPRDLMISNWKDSLLNFADSMSYSKQFVSLTIDVDFILSVTELHQMFRIIQEKLTNIFAHTTVKRVTLQIYGENGYLIMNFAYVKNKNSLIWLSDNYWKKKGRGSFVIHERLRILNAVQVKLIEDGYIHELIKFKPIQ